MTSEHVERRFRNYSTVSAGLPRQKYKGMIYIRSCFLCIECLRCRARATEEMERARRTCPRRLLVSRSRFLLQRFPIFDRAYTPTAAVREEAISFRPLPNVTQQIPCDEFSEYRRPIEVYSIYTRGLENGACPASDLATRNEKRDAISV